MILYKIRHKDTGKFSSGGSWPQFTSAGKVWRRLQDLDSHLRQLRTRGKYANAEIVCLVAEIDESMTSDASERMAVVDDRKAAVRQEMENRWTRARERREREELARLQEKWGK